MSINHSGKTRKITLVAILAAVIVVLQVITQFIKPGFFPITLSLTPIIVGAALCGPWAGGILGLIFGVMVLLDPATSAFMTVSAVGTVVTVLLKGALAGLAAGFVYRLLEGKNQYVAALCAGIVSPIVNTGVFFLGCLIFFWDYCAAVGAGAGVSGGAIPAILIVFIGANFFIELVVNVVLAAAITRILKAVKKA